MLTMTRSQLQRWTWITRGVLFGGIVLSIGANVLHSLTHQAPNAPDWKVWAGAVLAAFAPLGLFGCVEFIVHIPVVSRTLDATRLGATIIVGGFAAWVSYWHMVDVCEQLGETGVAPYLYPVVIDGIMVVATVSMIALTYVTVTADNRAQAEAEAAALADAEATIAQAAKAIRQQVDAEEMEARKKARYDRKTIGEKIRWTKEYRAGRDARTAKLAEAVDGRVPNAPAAAPVSPGVGPVGDYAGRTA